LVYQGKRPGIFFKASLLIHLLAKLTGFRESIPAECVSTQAKKRAKSVNNRPLAKHPPKNRPTLTNNGAIG